MKDNNPFLIVKYGKKVWFKVSILEVIYLTLKENNKHVSKSEIKRMYDQGGISLYATKGGTQEELKDATNILSYLEDEN